MMKVNLTNLSGSGSIKPRSLFNYSYSEDVTTLDPSNENGGTGQVSASALLVEGDKVGNTHPDSKLLINNQMLLEHQDGGNVQFIVKQVNATNGHVVSISGSTIADRLNAEISAAAHGGSGYTFLSAIQSYCELVGISAADDNLVFEDNLETELDAFPVNFIEWSGNLWQHIKMLCSAAPIDIEAYTLEGSLVFRKAKNRVADYAKDNLISQSVQVTTFDSAKTINVTNYNTSYGVDQVVHDVNVDRSILSFATQSASITEALQVDAGQTLVRRFIIDASLEEINQPQAVDAILPLPYTGGEGQYAIAGSDGVFINSTQWTAQGGSLTVSKTENPNEIEIRIVAPPVPSIPYVDAVTAADAGFSPYRIGVETADGQDYPALYITGTGVFYNKTVHELPTGASETFTTEPAATTIDNPFITNLETVYSRGIYAAQSTCGPNVSLSETVDDNLVFGETPGSMRTVGSAKYRIESVQYSQDNTSVTGAAMSTFADFEAKWSGLTFANFTSTALDPQYFASDSLKFNEFTIIPLMDPEVA
jgi:hypothetical protein